MVDSIVSVRMPSSLVQKLKDLSKENHFLDVSEEIRSIVKVKTQEYRLKLGPDSSKQEDKTSSQPLPKSDFKTENIVKEELVKKLKQMIKELEQ